MTERDEEFSYCDDEAIQSLTNEIDQLITRILVLAEARRQLIMVQAYCGLSYEDIAAKIGEGVTADMIAEMLDE